MSNELQKVVGEALALDVESQGILVDRLVVHLAQSEPAFLDEWLEESSRRFEAYERGEEPALDFDDAVETIRRQLPR
jgi:hypothetical protein